MKFFDYASNMTNPAQAEATARVRRDTIREGSALRVEFTVPSTGVRYYWNGGQYDCRCLYRELTFNNFEDVTISDQD